VHRDARGDTDVCVIGAGAAGIALARELGAAPFRVTVLESGGLTPDRRRVARDPARAYTHSVPEAGNRAGRAFLTSHSYGPAGGPLSASPGPAQEGALRCARTR